MDNVELHHDAVDVPKCLAKTTHDGRGDGELPPSDFISFATDGVEKEED